LGSVSCSEGVVLRAEGFASWFVLGGEKI
jgi:hypothetical protein